MMVGKSLHFFSFKITKLTVLWRSQGRQVGFRLQHHTRQWTDAALSICLTNCWGPRWGWITAATTRFIICFCSVLQDTSWTAIIRINLSHEIFHDVPFAYDTQRYYTADHIKYLKHMGWQWPKKNLIAIAWCSANKLRAASLGSWWCWVLESWRSNCRDNIWRSIVSIETIGKKWKDRTTLVKSLIS